jgi:N-acetylglutamate synthase-like GNAT family acetyltransferase/DNA-binding HxlR family transcriptional regulator
MAYSISNEYKIDEISIARYAKALGHPARIAILRYLASLDTCCFGDIHKELPIAKATVSQHLAELKNSGLITGTIEPPKVSYCINKEKWAEAKELFGLFLESPYKNPSWIKSCCATPDFLVYEALPEDLSKINTLLKRAQLPEIKEITSNNYYFKAIDQNEQIVGAIGLEIYNQYGLLRSMVVSPGFRNKGIAKRLIEIIEQLAISKHLIDIYLLTNTAQLYFEKKEYRVIPRNDVASEIKESEEFSSICPVSSVILIKHLSDN